MFVTVRFMTQSGLGVKILLRIRSSSLHFTSSPQTRTCPRSYSPPHAGGAGGGGKHLSFARPISKSWGLAKGRCLGRSACAPYHPPAHFLTRILPTHSSEEPHLFIANEMVMTDLQPTPL